MLTIHIPETSSFDEATLTFHDIKEMDLCLEHSLLSVLKWEQIWKKPFLKKNEVRTPEEQISYIQCMTINKKVDPHVYYMLTPKDLKEIDEYIADAHTATRIPKTNSNQSVSRETPTAELIYYWMIQLQIPIQFEKWHLNNLITLIELCEFKNSPKKKRSQKQLATDYKAMNEARLKAWNTTG